jgi:hypothetical protein
MSLTLLLGGVGAAVVIGLVAAQASRRQKAGESSSSSGDSSYVPSDSSSASGDSRDEAGADSDSGPGADGGGVAIERQPLRGSLRSNDPLRQWSKHDRLRDLS